MGVDPFVASGLSISVENISKMFPMFKSPLDRLKQQYFERDPADIIDIWLFRDNQSYMSHALQLFGDTPTTGFGYY